MKEPNSNKPIRVVHLQTLANQSKLIGTQEKQKYQQLTNGLSITKIKIWNQEKLWSFDKAKKKKKEKERKKGDIKLGLNKSVREHQKGFWPTLHEKQNFHINAESKLHIFLIFHNWRKYHVFRKMKIKEKIIVSIIFYIFRNKSIGQDFDKKNLIKL